ncbi:MAG: hypothetical protein ACOWWH_03080 [Eubacteriaceae bacterium]
MVDIIALLQNVDIDKMLYNGKEKTNWLWICRDTFRDIIYASDTEDNLKEKDIDLFLRMISDDDFIEIIDPILEKNGFINFKQDIFQLLDDSEKLNFNAYIYVKESYFNRLLIKANIKYEWVLMAMAIDYSKFVDLELNETYKEYFEGNSRIIEELINYKYYEHGDNKWDMDFKHNILYYRLGKKQMQWTKGETESTFNDFK